MALRIRFQYPTGSNLGISIERLADGMLYDFGSDTFVVDPTTPIVALPEDSGIYVGRYRSTLSPTPISQFANGHYCVTVHDRSASNTVVAELAASMYEGDDDSGGDDVVAMSSPSFPSATFDVLRNKASTVLVQAHAPADGFLYVLDASQFVAPTTVTCLQGFDSVKSYLAVNAVDYVNNKLTVVGPIDDTTDVYLGVGIQIQNWFLDKHYQDHSDAIAALQAGGVGQQGVTGSQGYQGPIGLQGYQGSIGSQGIQGLAGTNSTVAGPQGYQGVMGSQGASITGPQGNAGQAGSQGKQGFQGTVGATSTTPGPQGNQGFQGATGSGTGGGSPGGSANQIQYNDAGAFGGSSVLTTGTGNPFTVTYSSSDYINTGGANAHFLMNNPSSTGQSVVGSIINNKLCGKWRTDYVGNISWICGSGGTHTFYVGDYDSANQGAYNIPFVINTDSSISVGAYKGNVGSATKPIIPLTVTYQNTDYTNNNGINSHILIANPDHAGQNVVCSQINGVTVAKWRTDYVGNISWVAGTTGSHTFFVGGDYGVGFSPFQINNNGSIDYFSRSNTSYRFNAASGQTADLQQALDSSGNVLSGTSAGGYIRSVVGSGAPTTSPPSGSLYVDATNGALYVMVGTTWKKASLS